MERKNYGIYMRKIYSAKVSKDFSQKRIKAVFYTIYRKSWLIFWETHWFAYNQAKQTNYMRVFSIQYFLAFSWYWLSIKTMRDFDALGKSKFKIKRFYNTMFSLNYSSIGKLSSFYFIFMIYIFCSSCKVFAKHLPLYFL